MVMAGKQTLLDITYGDKQKKDSSNHYGYEKENTLVSIDYGHDRKTDARDHRLCS